MARTITITVSEGLEALLREAARARGISLEQAAATMLLERLEGVPTMPTDPDELRRALDLGMEGGDVVMTREDWDRKARELGERHRRSKAG